VPECDGDSSHSQRATASAPLPAWRTDVQSAPPRLLAP
jgi:hypothetical protein